jgi:hypothetical protein
MFGSFLAGTPREADVGVKNTRLRRCPLSSSLNVRSQVRLAPRKSSALHPGIFEHYMEE